MKAIFALLLATSCVLSAVGQDQAAPQPFAITISPLHDGDSSSDIIKAGEPLALTVTLVNNSHKSVSIRNMDFDLYYTIDVRDEYGNTAPETEEAREMREAAASPNHHRWISGANGILKPRQTWKHTLPVSHSWDMSRPGKYTIQVERQLPKELGKGSVKSNTITVTVTE